jgi:hypothetical protein
MSELRSAFMRGAMRGWCLGCVVGGSLVGVLAAFDGVYWYSALCHLAAIIGCITLTRIDNQ